MNSDEMPIYATSDERIVEIQGEALKVLKALEAVIGHLRKFLVDHSVLPLFEKSVSLLLFLLSVYYQINVLLYMLIFVILALSTVQYTCHSDAGTRT